MATETTLSSQGYLVTDGLTGMVVTDLSDVTAPVADWVTRMILMRRVRRSMTNVQYIAYCKSATPRP